MTNNKRLTATGDELAGASEQAKRYANGRRSANTQRANATAWAEFKAWALVRNAVSLPARVGTVIDYLTTLADAGARPLTIGA